MTNPATNPPNNSTPAPSIQLTTESVVTAYIREISERRRRSDRAPDDPRGTQQA
jgi:hypothetical protein